MSMSMSMSSIPFESINMFTTIPELPLATDITFCIFSTWGDDHYCGMTAIEVTIPPIIIITITIPPIIIVLNRSNNNNNNNNNNDNNDNNDNNNHNDNKNNNGTNDNNGNNNNDDNDNKNG